MAALVAFAATASISSSSAVTEGTSAGRAVEASGHDVDGDWSAAINLEHIPGTSRSLNTTATEGCPTISRDGRRLYFASNREGGRGGLDIWVSSREHPYLPWGRPVNAGAPVNTPADEFCPSPMPDGHGFMYVSTKPGGCGGADIYVTREDKSGGWPITLNVGCHVNSAAGEASPFIVDAAGRAELYFSSNQPGGFAPDGSGPPDSDIYVSVIGSDGSLAVPVLVEGVNTPQNDARPNLRRDGLEMIFDSDRPGTLGGSIDLFAAERQSRNDPWSEPINLGSAVNSTAAETRPSLSWDARTLYFGSTRVADQGSDMYVSLRLRKKGW
jgi:Tol biopolymer transport system component